MAKDDERGACRGLNESDVLRLRKIGLSDRCISSLNRAVHAIAPFLAERPTATAVRAPLQQLDDLLHQAQQLMIRMDRGEDPAFDEARRHLGLVEASLVERAPIADLDESPAWIKASLDRCRSAVGSALKIAPTTLNQRRKVARPVPARWVANALESHGFSKLAKGEAFEQIVEICFSAAVGGKPVSADRSIRAYRQSRMDPDWLDEVCREWARMANNKSPG